MTPEQERAASAFIRGASDETSQGEAPSLPASAQDDSASHAPAENPPGRPSTPGRAGAARKANRQRQALRAVRRQRHGADQEPDRLPWHEPQVRDDVVKGYALRLPEPLYLKLKYVSKQTGISMNQLCNEAVRGLVELELEELGVPGEAAR